MNQFDPRNHSHRRINQLNGEWVLVSPHRNNRPWQGQVEQTEAESRPNYDAACYLCPGNTRATGDRNPEYTDTFVFQNDFSSLLSDTPDGQYSSGLLQASSETGICRVVCFSPRHDLTLPQMEVAAVRRVVDLWIDQYRELGERPDINHVQIFENKGSVMGCSNPHPHGQVWAQKSIPNEVNTETQRQADYFATHGRALLDDYLDQELTEKERIVCANDHFVALVPYWATWPFETLVLCRSPVRKLTELTTEECDGLASIIKQLTTRYDNLFNCSFPYSAGIHQSPTDGETHPEWRLHLHFYPPLLRSATVRKFMVGYEMLADPQRDITPETSARLLAALSDLHYLANSDHA